MDHCQVTDEKTDFPGPHSQNGKAGAGTQAFLILSLDFCYNLTWLHVKDFYLTFEVCTVFGGPEKLLKQPWAFQEAMMCSELRGNGQGRKLHSKTVKIEKEILGYLG